jgi:hypothetical protein
VIWADTVNNQPPFGYNLRGIYMNRKLIAVFVRTALFLIAAAIAVNRGLPWLAAILVIANYVHMWQGLKGVGAETSIRKNSLMLLGGLLFLAGAGHLHMADVHLVLAAFLAVAQSYLGFRLMTAQRTESGQAAS